VLLGIGFVKYHIATAVAIKGARGKRLTYRQPAYAWPSKLSEFLGLIPSSYQRGLDDFASHVEIITGVTKDNAMSASGDHGGSDPDNLS
jgi:hypothetical protein